MSWTDKSAVRTIVKLSQEFNITRMYETGTFKGVNARLYANHFMMVFTCEKDKNYYKEVVKNLPPNVFASNLSSADFLFRYCNSAKSMNMFIPMPLFYLDAHFYDPSLPPDKRFVVLDELKELQDFGDCVIVIHDFKVDDLGHIVYDGIPLDFNLVKEALRKVNPNFVYYTNSKEFCDIVTIDEVKENKILGLSPTPDVLDNLGYVWSKPEKTYRGILYCVPKELDLKNYELKKLQND
jgi:hypothetical protein